MSKEEFTQLFLDEIKDIFDAENQIVKGLAEMIQAAESPELKNAFKTHLTETKNQVERLRKIFKMLKEPEKGEACEAAQGLIEECKEVISNYPASAIRDAGLIVGAQKIEHYEIATYGSLVVFAKELGLDEVADMLEDSLTEEHNADNKLTSIAEGGLLSSGINEKALS